VRHEGERRARGTARAGAVLLALAVVGAMVPIGAQIPKSDFFGTWGMTHDGWEGTLVLRGAGTAAGLAGDYVGADGKIHAVRGSVDGHKVVFTIDMKDTKAVAGDDQGFEGYLFTQTRTGMAGTTKFGSQTYGWSAVRRSGATSLPAPPIVSTDRPDPAETPVVVGSSGELRLSTTKPEYAAGEAVGFELKNTQNKVIDLTGFYYIIERRDEQQAREFYTSAKEPFGGVQLKTGDTRAWFWDQRDNERQNKAAPGRWRIRFFAPAALDKPFVVHFSIKAS